MQWLIDIIAEKVIAEIGIPPVFIDRGDPAALDFVLANFTRDGAWHDLDLSPIVPAGAKSVSIHAECLGGLAQKYMLLRTKGNNNEINISGVRTQVANFFQHKDWVIPLDENRFIQYKTNWLIIGLLNLTVKGWWL